MAKVDCLLRSHQSEVFPQINENLDKYRICRDTSDGGLGKTELAFFVAKHRNMEIGCVTIKDLMPDFRKRAERHGVKIAFLINYELLRGQGQNCKHDLLVRNEDDYEVSPYWKQRFSEDNILVVFEEHQKAKTAKSLQHKACCALAQEVRLSTTSLLYLSSSTPLAEKVNIGSIPKLCGVTTHDELVRYDPENHVYEKLAFGQLEVFCSKINPILTKELVPRNITDKNAQTSFYNLVTKILVPAVTVNMKKEPDIDNKTVHTVQNRFFEPETEEDHNLLNAASIKLSRMRGICVSQKTPQLIPKYLNEYNKLGEKLKIYPTVKAFLKLKEMEPNLKVLFFVWRKSSPRRIIRLLKGTPFEGRIAVINGDTPIEERHRIRNTYQQPNNDIDLVIGNANIFGVGGDWHDQDGRFPRAIFIIANEQFIPINQARKRADREGGKSDTCTYIVFIDRIPQEVSLLDKFQESKKTLSDVRNHEFKFPNLITKDSESPLVCPHPRKIFKTSRVL